MSQLIVLAFDKENKAEVVKRKIEQLQKEKIVNLDDAAVVVRKQNGKVNIKQANDLVGAGALGGSFWGLLIGLLFMMPWLGLAIGAISGALIGKHQDIGIDDNFIKEVGDTIKPGQSAIFLLVSGNSPDRFLEEMEGTDAKVLKTSLSKEKEAKLKEAFGAGK